MVDFNIAYDRTMLAEGGYKLTDIPGDAGGQTYAGISRRANPDWPGWAEIDAGRTPATADVRNFYRAKYWNKVNGDFIVNQSVADSIYDFAVNAGVSTSVKLAQVVLGLAADGVPGPKTLAALNSMDPEKFSMAFTIAKISRYEAIVTKNRAQGKFLLGWIRRALKGLA
jgi:lysozyme family protein